MACSISVRKECDPFGFFDLTHQALATVLRKELRQISSLLILAQCWTLSGCSDTPILQAGAVQIGEMNAHQGGHGQHVIFNGNYRAPNGPLTIPDWLIARPALDHWREVEWGLDLDDALDSLGPLEPTFGQVLAQPPLRQRIRDRTRYDTPNIPGVLIERWQSSAGCGLEFDGGHGLFSDCGFSRDPRAENPDDDSYLAFAEYRSTASVAQESVLGDTGMSVRVFYLFCAEHISESQHPIGREFSKADLVLCGQRLMFEDSDANEARRHILSWLVRQFGTTSGLEAVVRVSESIDGSAASPEDQRPRSEPGPPWTPTLDSISKDPAERADPEAEQMQSGVRTASDTEIQESRPLELLLGPPPSSLEQYRWCGPEKGGDAYTPCSAAITFAYDPSSRYGTVLIATPKTYHFLSAWRHLTTYVYPRRFAGAIRIFALLYADPATYADGKGPLLCKRCGPDNLTLPADKRVRFTPDSD